MTVHLVSVGITVLEFLADPHHHLGPAYEDLAETIQASRAERVIAEQIDPDNQAASRWLAERLDMPTGERGPLAELVRRIQPQRWPAKVSAELETFTRAGASYPLSRNDIAVLLATDTIRGLTAALWNAVALTAGDLAYVRYVATPAEMLEGFRGCAVVVRVPGLDARTRRGFRIAMGGLGRLGRNLIGSAGEEGVSNAGESFRFYLSGGFKAAIPYLIGLAEALRSLEGAHPVEAFVLHETTDADPIPFPLRRLPAELVRSELAGFDLEGRHSQEPKSDLLEGYAYEQVGGGGWELTAFGEGLRELFGASPEVTGG